MDQSPAMIFLRSPMRYMTPSAAVIKRFKKGIGAFVFAVVTSLVAAALYDHFGSTSDRPQRSPSESHSPAVSTPLDRDHGYLVYVESDHLELDRAVRSLFAGSPYRVTDDRAQAHLSLRATHSVYSTSIGYQIGAEVQIRGRDGTTISHWSNDPALATRNQDGPDAVRDLIQVAFVSGKDELLGKIAEAFVSQDVSASR